MKILYKRLNLSIENLLHKGIYYIKIKYKNKEIWDIVNYVRSEKNVELRTWMLCYLIDFYFDKCNTC